MEIANNILKHNLRNVFFLGGTACGGKTTMGRALAARYGFVHYDDNYHTETFANFSQLCEARYQPGVAQVNEIRARSWEEYFGRLAAGDDMLDKSEMDYLQFILMELVKLSRDRTVIADIHLPVDLAKEITEYSRVAFLVTSAEMVVKDYCRRDDHRDIHDLIMTLREPGRSLGDLHTFLQLATRKFLSEVRGSGMYHIMRDEASTVEGTLSLLENHFGLVRQ